jgi:thiamine-phosphate pyrophosphorylase
MPNSNVAARFRIYLITNRELAAAAGGLPAAVEAALEAAAELEPPGVVAVQLREKDLEARRLYELALTLGSICRRFGAPLIVNDRVDIAMATEADGVHLSSTSFTVHDARTLLGPSRLIGISTHNVEEVSAAVVEGADFAVFGPVYKPLSKDSYGPPKGLRMLKDAVRAANAMPLYALGGIDASRAAEIAALESGCRPLGVATIGTIFGAPDPAAAMRELLRSFNPL